MSIEPYLCKLTNQTFSTPCSVSSCPAHVGNLNRCGVKVVSSTNCAHADFNLQGFSEPMSYAVEEQGFVGYRDLKYMESFFNVNEIDLRDIYTQNVTIFRKLVALTWAVNQLVIEEQKELHYCSKCGYPTKDSFKCVSASLCAERREVVQDELKELVPYLTEKVLASFFYILWRSLKERFVPPVQISNENMQKMQEVKGPNL